MKSQTNSVIHINELLSTQIVNIARFARNVEWDFLWDFQTPCVARFQSVEKLDTKGRRTKRLQNCFEGVCEHWMQIEKLWSSVRW